MTPTAPAPSINSPASARIDRAGCRRRPWTRPAEGYAYPPCGPCWRKPYPWRGKSS